MSEQPDEKDAGSAGIGDEDLPEDLQPGEDNPLAEPLEPGEAPDVDLNEPSPTYARELEERDGEDGASDGASGDDASDDDASEDGASDDD